MLGCRNLTDAEIQALTRALSIRDRALFILGLRTGFRINEILSLDVRDVLNSDSSMKNSVSVPKRNMKGQVQGRTVPMHPEAAATIQEYLQAVPPIDLSVPLFRTGKKRRMEYTTFLKLLKGACSRAQVNTDRVATHSLRKTYIEKVKQVCNSDPFKMMVLTGHKSISSLQNYIQVDEQALWDAMKNAK